MGQDMEQRRQLEVHHKTPATIWPTSQAVSSRLHRSNCISPRQPGSRNIAEAKIRIYERRDGDGESHTHHEPRQEGRIPDLGPEASSDPCPLPPPPGLPHKPLQSRVDARRSVSEWPVVFRRAVLFHNPQLQLEERRRVGGPWHAVHDQPAPPLQRRRKQILQLVVGDLSPGCRRLSHVRKLDGCRLLPRDDDDIPDAGTNSLRRDLAADDLLLPRSRDQLQQPLRRPLHGQSMWQGQVAAVRSGSLPRIQGTHDTSGSNLQSTSLRTQAERRLPRVRVRRWFPTDASPLRLSGAQSRRECSSRASTPLERAFAGHGDAVAWESQKEDGNVGEDHQRSRRRQAVLAQLVRQSSATLAACRQHRWGSPEELRQASVVVCCVVLVR